MNLLQRPSSLLLLAIFCLSVSPAHAELSKSQARNLIRRMAGAELPGSAVRVQRVTANSDGTESITADVKTIFRFQKSKEGRWRVAEVRTGQDRWQRVDGILRALNYAESDDNCTAPDPPSKKPVDPSVKRARCLIAGLLGVKLPSDQVRIQQVSPMDVPLVNEPSALVEAWVQVNARAARGQRGWTITDLRTGNGNWVALDSLVGAIESDKQRQARSEMEAMAAALEKYRRERGAFVIADSQAILIDHISPRYLLPVMRLDPWNQPYQYQGERDRFTIASMGPDRKNKTADDITVSRSQP